MADENGARGGAEGGIRWETYPAGADLLGMKVESFRRLAFRKGWRRIPGNDGLARVAIPLAEIDQRRAGHPPGAADAAPGSATPGALGGNAPAEPQALSVLADALRQERERREAVEAAARLLAEGKARAEGEAAGLKEAVRLAEEGRRDMQTERDAARGELAGLRIAFEQQQGRAARAEGELAATEEARRHEQARALRAEGEGAGLRDAAARAEAQAAAERAARQAAEAAREAARGELAELTAGGRLRRAMRAFAFRRGRP